MLEPPWRIRHGFAQVPGWALALAGRNGAIQVRGKVSFHLPRALVAACGRERMHLVPVVLDTVRADRLSTPGDQRGELGYLAA